MLSSVCNLLCNVNNHSQVSQRWCTNFLINVARGSVRVRRTVRRMHVYRARSKVRVSVSLSIIRAYSAIILLLWQRIAVTRWQGSEVISANSMRYYSHLRKCETANNISLQWKRHLKPSEATMPLLYFQLRKKLSTCIVSNNTHNND